MQGSNFSTLPQGTKKALEPTNENAMFIMLRDPLKEPSSSSSLTVASFPTTTTTTPATTMDAAAAAAAAATTAWQVPDKSGYTDHMNDPDGDYMAASDIMRKTQGAGGCSTTDQSFPVRLHYMLNEIEGDGLAHVIAWAPHGRSFVVHKPKVFTEQVLGNWFRMSKYASFQRQLNIYGFQRLTTGPEKGGYFHELFLRTKPGLAYRIQRHKVKGTGTRKAADPEMEPDFYHMPSLPHNKRSSFTLLEQQQQQHPTPKLGVLVAGPQGFCGSAAATSNAAIAAAASSLAAPAGGIKCSLRSLAPIFLAESQPAPPAPPPPQPAITTGFSVYSTGAAPSVVTGRHNQPPTRASFTTTAVAAPPTNSSVQVPQGLVAAAISRQQQQQQQSSSSRASFTATATSSQGLVAAAMSRQQQPSRASFTTTSAGNSTVQGLGVSSNVGANPHHQLQQQQRLYTLATTAGSTQNPATLPPSNNTKTALLGTPGYHHHDIVVNPALPSMGAAAVAANKARTTVGAAGAASSTTAPPTTTATKATTTRHTTGYVGPLVHPLLRENNSSSSSSSSVQRATTVPAGNKTFFTSVLSSCPSGTGATSTSATNPAGTGQSTRPKPKYEIPDFSAGMMFM